MDEKISVWTFGGYKVIYYHLPSPLVSCRCVFNAGSFNETDPKDYGSAHFLEHLFFKGTEKKDWRQIDKELAALGDCNAYTSHDKTGYWINSLTEDFEKTFDLLCELIFESRFDPAEFVKENTVIQEEIQMYLDDPNGYFFDHFTESVWGSGGHNITGTKETVAAMTVDNLLRFKKDNYDKGNMIFIIVGGLEARQLDHLKTLEKYANHIPEGSTRKWETIKPNLEDLDFSHTSTQAILSMTLQGLTSQESESRNYADDLFLNALGQATHSVLKTRIRQELGLCYSIGAFNDGIGVNNAIVIFTMIDAKNVDLVHSEILKSYRQIQEKGFDEEMLKISKKSILYRTCRNMTTPVGIASTLFEDYFIDGIFDLEGYRKAIVSLTNKDMIEFANETISSGIKLTVMNRSK